MDAARRERKEHGTLSFPFQVYPALDGSEAGDSDFIPYHWHPELEVIEVDSGRVSLTISDHVYEGTRGDIFFAASEELHEIRAAGRENQFRSFVFAADFLQFARADETEFALLEPLAQGKLRFSTCIRAGEPGQAEVLTLLTQIVRAWQQQAPGCQLAVKAALLGIVAVCAQYGRLEGRSMRPGADYKARQLREIVGYLGEHFGERSRQQLDGARGRLMRAGAAMTDPYRASVAVSAARLHDLSPLAIIGRGYAMAKGEDGRVVSSVDGVAAGGRLVVTLSDGELDCTVDDIRRIHSAVEAWD